MSENINKVAFLMDKSSIIVAGLEGKIEAEGYETVSVSESFDKLGSQIEDAGVVVLYNPQSIIDARYGAKNIVLIKDQIRDHDCSVILIGEAGDKELLMKEHPEFIAHRWIDRPVDPDMFASAIEEEMNNYREKVAKKELLESIKNEGKEQEVKPAPVVNSVPDDGRKRILLVDDDPDYAKMVRSWIKDKYKTDIVTAGMQAITYLMKKKVDLILLDYEMPVVDGPQVLQMLRQEETTKDIPIVFLTGVSTVEGVKRVMALKPLGYILKSTTSKDLLAFLDEKLQ